MSCFSCGCGCDCGCDCCNPCNQGPKPPGPAIGAVPCALQLATQSAVEQLVSLLTSPQNLPAFAARLSPNAVLTVNGGPPTTGIPAIVAAVSAPLGTQAIVTLEAATFGSTNGGQNLTVRVDALETIIPQEGPSQTFPLTLNLTYDANCLITRLDITGLPQG